MKRQSNGADLPPVVVGAAELMDKERKPSRRWLRGQLACMTKGGAAFLSGAINILDCFDQAEKKIGDQANRIGALEANVDYLESQKIRKDQQFFIDKDGGGLK